MNITEVRVTPQSAGKVLAFACIVIDGEFKINSLKIVDGEKGVFVAYPDRRDDGTGKWHTLCHPITEACRCQIDDAVLNEYDRVVGNATPS